MSPTRPKSPNYQLSSYPRLGLLFSDKMTTYPIYPAKRGEGKGLFSTNISPHPICLLLPFEAVPGRQDIVRRNIIARIGVNGSIWWALTACVRLEGDTGLRDPTRDDLCNSRVG